MHPTTRALAQYVSKHAYSLLANVRDVACALTEHEAQELSAEAGDMLQEKAALVGSDLQMDAAWCIAKYPVLRQQLMQGNSDSCKQ